jgi:hypothetical protein
VAAATSYLISISSVSVIGESERRSPATLIWAVETPSAPVIQVTGTTRDSCSLLWGPVTPPSVPGGAALALITGYVMLIDDGVAGPFRAAYDGSTDPSKFTTSIYGLTAQTSYRISGYALNKAGAGANATQITCFTAATPGVPGTPSLVSSTSTSIKVSWEPAFDDGGSPIKEYQLAVDAVEGVGPANIETWTTDTGTALTFDKTGLTATKAYRFKVKAVSEELLQSPFSSIATFWSAPLPAQIAFNTVADAHL